MDDQAAQETVAATATPNLRVEITPVLQTLRWAAPGLGITGFATGGCACAESWVVLDAGTNPLDGGAFAPALAEGAGGVLRMRTTGVPRRLRHNRGGEGSCRRLDHVQRPCRGRRDRRGGRRRVRTLCGCLGRRRRRRRRAAAVVLADGRKDDRAGRDRGERDEPERLRSSRRRLRRITRSSEPSSRKIPAPAAACFVVPAAA